MLMVIDVQRDFCEGGALVARNTASLLGPLNALVMRVARHGRPIVFTRDWHPGDHSSFRAYGGVWPVHCVAHTEGAMFHPELIVPSTALIVSKGTSRQGSGYSGFENQELRTAVMSYSHPVLVAGIALEYCVRATCLDGLTLGAKMVIVRDLVRSASSDEKVTNRVWDELESAGCGFTTSGAIRGL